MSQSMMMVCTVLAAAWLAAGCSSEVTPSQSESTELGKVGLPLKTYGSSGTEYRLRHAEFDLVGYSQTCREEVDGEVYCEYYDSSINSEDYLEEDSILLDLASGEYEIYLNSGWQLERTLDGVTEVVDAVLLNGSSQWIWVSPHSTSWISFEFGVGDEEIWLNGQVNLGIQVYEDPDEYYRWEGVGGAIVTGGSPSIAGGAFTGGAIMMPEAGGSGPY